MNIIVCVKAVSDPETAAHYVVSGLGLQTGEKSNKIVLEGVEIVISPFDALAAEAALRIKDDLGDEVSITVLSLGDEESFKILRRVLAMGADQAILLQDDLFEDANDYVTTQALAGAIRRIGSFDLILCGRQAGDVDSGVVGSGLAEVLAIPSVTVAKGVEIRGETAVVERGTPEEIETIEIPLPALVTVSSELGEPRYPKMRRILEAKRKKIPIWTARDVGLTTEQIKPQQDKLKLESLSVVEIQGECTFLEGESADDMAGQLIQKLREERVLQP